MANQINVTDLGVYSEVDGSAITVTDLGVYLESLEFTNEIDVTVLGSYVEIDASIIQIDSYGAYVEISVPLTTFAIIYNGYNFCDIKSIKFNQNVSVVDTTILTDIAGTKIPIIPSWQIDVGGLWCQQLALSLGNLGDSDLKMLSAIITDKRTNRSYEFRNTESFITSFVTDINIDNVLIYSVTFVGSGNLIFGEYT